MSWVAVAIGGSAVLGGLLSSNSAQNAANVQSQAANQASSNSLQEFNTINQQQAPWRQAGSTAIGQLSNMTAPGGSLVQPFTTADLNANLAPNYQFMLNQGLGQAQNQFNASGGLVGGNALQGLNTFAQNYAQNAYQNAFNNWQANQTNIYNRLAGIAGTGQTAANTVATAGTNLVGQANNYLTGAAAAQAAGQVGGANAWSQGIQGVGSGVLLSSLLNQNSLSPYAGVNPGGYTQGGTVYPNPSAFSQ